MLLQAGANINVQARGETVRGLAWENGLTAITATLRNLRESETDNKGTSTL